MEFKDIFKRLRIEKGMSQDQLSKAIGVSRSAIGMYEQGKREPDFETLEVIADFFNVNMDYLLGRSNIQTPQLKKQIKDYVMVFDDVEIELLEALRKSDDTTKEMIQRILLFKAITDKEE